MKKLYYGGPILTMGTPASAEGVLTEDGKIIKVGSLEEMKRQGADAVPVDLKGRTMLPGFVDAHGHFTQTAMGFLQVSLEGAESEEEIRRRIQDFIDRGEIRPGSWIQARDYDHNQLPGGRHLSREAIQGLAPGYALAVHHKSGHSGLFNRMALERAGIAPDTKEPAGGRIGRDENGLTGYLEENAYFMAAKQIPMPDSREILNAYQKAQGLYASFGVTTMQEGMLVKQMLPLYRMLLDSDILKLDLIAYPDLETLAEAEREIKGAGEKAPGHVRIGGIKIFLDGSPQGRTAWMTEPYAGEEAYQGYGTMKDGEVLEALAEAGRRKLQILAHCNGDAAAEQFLDCLEKAERTDPELIRLRPVMIHSQFLRADQMPRTKALGVIASFFTAHTWYWGDVHVKNLGIKRASQISAASSALSCGLPFTLHQDSPVIQPDMLETVWCAVNRFTKNGRVLGSEQRISVREALKAVTVNAAYQYFEENEKGSIAPGKREDFVILSDNPLCVPPDRLRDIWVEETLKDGQQIYRR